MRKKKKKIGERESLVFESALRGRSALTLTGLDVLPRSGRRRDVAQNALLDVSSLRPVQGNMAAVLPIVDLPASTSADDGGINERLQLLELDLFAAPICGIKLVLRLFYEAFRYCPIH
jgi:hypothetical protein